MPGESKVVKLHPEAQTELQNSVSFYRERGGERLVSQFKQRVAEGIAAIADDPDRYRPDPELRGARKVRLKQFPFSLIYIHRPDYVWIVAVAHGSRRPGYWKERG
jgi:toxin ParE1/3/4